MSTSPRLSRPLKPKYHEWLVTLDDAHAYMLALPKDMAEQNAWQQAAALALDARISPSRETIGALTKQIELALFITHRLDLG